VENLAFFLRAWIVSPRTGSLESFATSGLKATDPQFPKTYYDEFVFLLSIIRTKTAEKQKA
tara:strand:+ start:289 stop:471 length:183 start_codon:yes stop_codon:yes gene_type:complete